MNVLIIDSIAPRAYSAATLREQPLGGTEATVVRLAEALDATVMQHNREADEGRYRSRAADVDPSHVVVLRDAAAALEAVARYPRARHFLWLHDLAGPKTDRGKRLRKHGVELARAGVTVVCVSDFHAEEIRQTLRPSPETPCPEVIRIYNPVVAPPPSDSYDPNKLVFFSSPHKGLEYALHTFTAMRSRNRDLRLVIANPGYQPNETRAWPGVRNLGAVPHHVIMEEAGSALCTFYPNYIYPETFGLVLAESNSMGTPVLTHRIGAAPEVLSGPDQFIEVPGIRDLADSVYWRMPKLRAPGERVLGWLGFANAYAARIRQWQQGGRPAVHGKPEFALATVADAWRTVFEARA